MSNLNKLMYLQGISSEYYSYSGSRIDVPWATRIKILEQMGCQPESDAWVEERIRALDELPWSRWLDQQHILRVNEDGCGLQIRLHPDELSDTIRWNCQTESKQNFSGTFVAQSLQETGNYMVGHMRYSARLLRLPELPLGYHSLTLTSTDRRCECELIITPPTCYQPAVDGVRQNFFGISCQLYTLRSERNWGIGDFTDLRQLIEHCASLGIDLIGLNPLHAPNMQGGSFASPYSPSDRRFLNPLYIDPLDVPDYAPAGGDSFTSSPQIAERLIQLRAIELVDHDAVAELKLQIFRMMHQSFVDLELASDTDRAIEFKQFVSAAGDDLQCFANHQAKSYRGSQLQQSDPGFYCYLQWLASGQLLACQELARDSGMRIGLKGDLAVGSVRDGAEVQTNRELYANSAMVGAPPDQFSSTGQNWNLPALNPVALKNSGYRQFISLLRRNMRFFGALRIDHVMAMMRLWWCLPDNRGAYVYYPLDDLLAILRLESQRHGCYVIGEDMGVVPPEMREAMQQSGLYGNRLLYFDRNHDGSFTPPSQHQTDVMFMVTNHDVPTLAGWWNGVDISLRQKYGGFSAQEACTEREIRQSDKHRLLQMLAAAGVAPDDLTDPELLVSRSLSTELMSIILLTCAQSAAQIVLVQLDDLLLIEAPVNIPGTYLEYPNWRRKQTSTLDQTFADKQIIALLSDMRIRRPFTPAKPNKSES